ncbi:unnamed protein product [Caenorhabditis angaria]|uniref:ubiquitinyl hydrolase 1 n=1 Tax=Caenorhabditis angaria TaxID=860376 RepID=A0A9P1II47_9PELO|nr:unnamed protein product [Caenorhabditis angaria]
MRDFERTGDQRGFNYFENPLDDVYEISQQNAQISPNFNTNHNNQQRRQQQQNHHFNNNSDDLLIDTYDILPDFNPQISSSQPGSSESVLVDLREDDDIQEARNTAARNKSPTSNYVITILKTRIGGLKFDRRDGKLMGPRHVLLEPGLLLKTIKENDWKMEIIWKLEKPGMFAPMEGLDDNTICAKVSSSDVMNVTQEQALQLLSLCPAERLELYNDFERLEFITRLKVGDPVVVKLGENMRRSGHINWIGDRPNEHGIWYNVNFGNNDDFFRSQHFDSNNSTYDRINRQFDTNFGAADMSGTSSLASNHQRNNYYSPNQLHMPMKGGGVQALYDNRIPVRLENTRDREVRNIPIDVLPPSNKSSDSRRSRFNDTPPEHPPIPPSRSKSVHNMSNRSPAAKNEPIYDESGFRCGDACIWNNNGIDEYGIVKFIGRLKGHTALYAGVEFKNRIGAGTGIFNKQQLFTARDGHAGFVELSSLEPVPGPIPTSNTTISISSNSRQKPTVSGNGTISIPVSNRSSNSNPNPDSYPYHPPTYTPPSPPRAQSAQSTNHLHQPPPIPPKPFSAVEDYLINSFDIGHRVIINHLGAQRDGIVKWLGDARNEQNDGLEQSAVVQLDDYYNPTQNQIPNAWRPSDQYPNSVLVPLSSLHRNRIANSIQDNYGTNSGGVRKNMEEFGIPDSGIEKNRIGPVKDSEKLIGRQKGIQGFANSCYLDATLYAMFVQSTIFDSLLEKNLKSSPENQKFQKHLAHEIVFPLRKNHYVRADHIMKLRQILAQLMPHMTGLTNEEKDPEEILEFIFSKIFDAPPFVRLSNSNSGKSDSQYLVPIVVDSDWQGGAVTSQHLLERHLKSAQVQFSAVPPVLIMQLPRYGQQKLFDKILPLDKIDITPFVAKSVPACSQCGQSAECYCPTCFLTRRVFYTDIIYCSKCFRQSHLLAENEDHQKSDLSYPNGKLPKKPSSHKMNLTAILCIETSHYVAYVKTISGNWIFFDSMADREGLSDGFNVPVVRDCGDLSNFLSIVGWNRLKEADETGQLKSLFGKQVIDPLVDRLLSDGYICFYEDANSNSSSFSTEMFNLSSNSTSSSGSHSFLNQIKNKLS